MSVPEQPIRSLGARLLLPFLVRFSPLSSRQQLEPAQIGIMMILNLEHQHNNLSPRLTSQTDQHRPTART
eukprot:3062983-Rhodomonas_salina.1